MTLVFKSSHQKLFYLLRLAFKVPHTPLKKRYTDYFVYYHIWNFNFSSIEAWGEIELKFYASLNHSLYDWTNNKLVRYSYKHLN